MYRSTSTVPAGTWYNGHTIKINLNVVYINYILINKNI